MLMGGASPSVKATSHVVVAEPIEMSLAKAHER
jgi:hypothetical protein